jgi:1-acyl-sn-glycerol-3-phosphate acyltransferase
MNLSQTTKDILEKIEIAEKEKRFNDHLDPTVNPNYIKVDENHKYIWGFKEHIKYGLLKIFPVGPYCFIANNFWLKTKVYGKKNLKGLKSAITTCNHVNKLDAIAIKKALGRRKFRVTVAEFNNLNCSLGTYMRAFGIMPLSSDIKAMKNFNRSVSKMLDNKTFINFFAEQSEWWCYEKPRPVLPGAYHYAVNNNAPILPLFITFTKTGKYDENEIEKRKFHIHILKPIYPKKELSKKEDIEYLMKENMNAWIAKYEEFYKIKYEL